MEATARHTVESCTILDPPRALAGKPDPKKLSPAERAGREAGREAAAAMSRFVKEARAARDEDEQTRKRLDVALDLIPGRVQKSLLAIIEKMLAGAKKYRA